MIGNQIKGKRVAVVGNAESIIGSGQGEKIDSYDIVIRINLRFPKEEEYKDVGKRTDINYIGHWLWHDEPSFMQYKEEFGSRGTVKGIPTFEKDGFIMGLLNCGLTGVICLYDCLHSECGELGVFGFDCLHTPDRYSQESRLNLPPTEIEAYDKSQVLLKTLYEENKNVMFDSKLHSLMSGIFKEKFYQTTLSKYVSGKTVSVVGSAASIIPNGDGEEIDKRDVVIRVNLEFPLEPKDYPYVGKRTDLNYVNNDIFKRLTVDDKILGVTVINQPETLTKRLCVKDVIERWGYLVHDRKLWCPMSGITCVYACLASGAKEVYITGFDFYRSNNRLSTQNLVVGGSREFRLGNKDTDSWTNSLKDELCVKAMIDEGYPIVLDKVLKEIYA